MFNTYDQLYSSMITPLLATSSPLSSSYTTPESKTTSSDDNHHAKKKRRYDSSISMAESKTSSTSIMIGTTLSSSSSSLPSSSFVPSAALPAISNDDYNTSLFGAGWLLFLHAKGKISTCIIMCRCMSLCALCVPSRAESQCD